MSVATCWTSPLVTAWESGCWAAAHLAPPGFGQIFNRHFVAVHEQLTATDVTYSRLGVLAIQGIDMLAVVHVPEHRGAVLASQGVEMLSVVHVPEHRGAVLASQAIEMPVVHVPEHRGAVLAIQVLVQKVHRCIAVLMVFGVVAVDGVGVGIALRWYHAQVLAGSDSLGRPRNLQGRWCRV